MRAVQEKVARIWRSKWLTNQLHASRPLHRGKPFSNRRIAHPGHSRVAHRVQCCKRNRCVVSLVLTEESNLHQSEAREFHLNPVATARANRTAHRLSEHGTNVACSLADHAQRTAAFTRSGDRAIAWHDDRRLLLGDQLNCVAEILLMIESNIRHHRHAAVPGVHGV